MKAYYYVYRVGHGKPTVQHPTLEEATREALRLSGQHPGETFEILKCLARARTVTPALFWTEGNEPGEAGVKDSVTLQPDKDGWIPHSPGDPMPVKPDGWVEVRLRSGVEFSRSMACSLCWWRHTDPQMEIVAWKPSPTSPTAGDRMNHDRAVDSQ